MNILTGQSIASKLDVRFDGIQKDFPTKDNDWYQFTDKLIGSTFLAKNLEMAETRLKNLRIQFELVKGNI